MAHLLKKIAFAALFLCVAATSAFAQDKIRTVIIDGQNNHDWKATTPYLVKILENTGKFTVDVATTPAQGEDVSGFNVDFSKYDLVVMNYNGARWNKGMEKAFVDFIVNGGGMVAYHAGNNSFADWPAYNEMIGLGGWGGRNHDSGPYLYIDDNGNVVIDPVQEGPSGDHGPQWEFLIDNRAPEHPIMKGLPASFRHCQDELYQYQRGPAHNVTVLASAYAPKDRRGSGRSEPLVIAIPYGKGRCVTNMLGHGPDQMKSVDTIVLMQRCCEWAATGNVTIPVPDNFPGVDKPVFDNPMDK